MAWSDGRGRLRESVEDSLALTREYLASQAARVPLQVALFVIVLVLTRLARSRARRRIDKTPSEEAAARVFEAPLSSALVLALLTTAWIYPEAPRSILNLVALLVLLPAVVIVRRLASPSLTPAVHALAAFFLVDRIREVCAVVPALEQWVFLLEMLSGIVFLALAIRESAAPPAASPGADRAARGWQPLVTWVLVGELLLLACALLVGALGFMRLARLLGGGVLASSYAALVLYAAVRVAGGLVAFGLRARPLRQLLMVQRHRDLLQRRMDLALWGLSVGIWAYLTLDWLGVTPSIWSAATAAVDARYVRGSVSLSLGDVAAVGLTIGAAFLLSSLVRFVLQEDVYPRVAFPRGVPYAISTLIHYAVILVGFLLAVAALGIDLTRVTILAGAFGVGVGIGLQSVVANFVAGLVVLIERRIHVGDSVQLGDLQGEIREIGRRASTIRTWDGAEVIVPNATLTSERLVNWTLSDRTRRVDLPLDTAFASDPGRVLAILSGVAATHPQVLAQPAPTVLCTGFGAGAVNFQLRVWTRVEESEVVRSQLALAVHAALTAARIPAPLPLHLHLGDGEPRETVA